VEIGSIEYRLDCRLSALLVERLEAAQDGPPGDRSTIGQAGRRWNANFCVLCQFREVSGSSHYRVEGSLARNLMGVSAASGSMMLDCMISGLIGNRDHFRGRCHDLFPSAIAL
jgi:hypothetical protein